MRQHLVPPASLIGMLAILSGCSTTSTEPFTPAGKIMSQLIQERIDRIPYQHKDELLSNLQWLSQQGEQAIPYLVPALDHEVPKVRSNAAWVLGVIGDKRSIPFLQSHSEDSSPIVRLEISRSLLLLGDYSHVPELIEGLDSEHSHIRFLCFSVLSTTTGKKFDYDLREKDEAKRKKSVEQWRQWWNTQRGDAWFSEKNSDYAAPGKG
ncbi:MAG: HEAT repeat domain-containing protein [Planctomycetota bacterium]